MPAANSFPRVVALLTAVSLFVLASPAGVDAPRASAIGKDAKLDSAIAGLIDAAPSGTAGAQQPGAGALAMPDSGLMRFDGAGRLVTYVYASGPLSPAAAAVKAGGGAIQRTSSAMDAVQAAIPLDRVRNIAASPAVRYVGLPRYPVLNAGGHVTEGDAILGVDEMRAVYGVDGTGVKVGVISDGINEFEKSQQSGDLPPQIDYTTCNVVPEFDPTTPIAGGEGTAILEIVHDLAPGAQLWFGSFAFGSADHGTEMDFMEAVTCLAQHVDIVVDDLSWFGDGPYDGTSAVSLNTSDQLNGASNPIRLYTTSAGNWAQRHYSETFEPCPATNLQRFQATARTVDSQSAGPRCNNPVTVAPLGTAHVYLQWDDPFGASCHDYDLILTQHDTPAVLAASQNPQTCTQDPVEVAAWRNTTVSPVTVDVRIENVDALAAPRKLDLFAIVSDMAYYTPAGSVPNQGDAGGGVISVGAIGAFDPGADDIEPYSSRGPTADGRTKPDITATDCVNVTGHGLPPPFCGTSASAPHIAAIAALLLDCNPGLLAAGAAGSPSEARTLLSSAILESAQDRGDPGADYVYGTGLVDAPAAAEVVCPAHFLGDVDCNAGVNAVDSLFILRQVAGIGPDAPCIGLGDVDCDGTLDAVDSLAVLRFVAGIPLTPPPGCRPIGS